MNVHCASKRKRCTIPMQTAPQLAEDILRGVTQNAPGRSDGRSRTTRNHRRPTQLVSSTQARMIVSTATRVHKHINLPWIARQERHYRDILANQRKCSGTIWGRKLFSWMWMQAYIVWKHRCETLHGKEGPSLKVHDKLTAKVKEMYKQKEDLRTKI